MIKKFDDLTTNTADELFEQDLTLSILAGIRDPLLMPHFHKASRTGVLVIHGFSASPHEVLPLVEELENRDFSVYAPRVAGHGISIEALINTTYEEWYKSLELGYNALCACCDEIIVIGQSNGALLATLVATYNKVYAIGLLAPAFKVRIPGFSLIGYLQYVISSVPRKLTEYEKNYNYDRFPTKSLYEMKLLQDYVQTILDKVYQRILLMVSKNDILISPKFAIKSVKKTKSGDIKYILDVDKYQRIIHIVTERKSEILIKLIADWVEGLKRNE